MHTHTQKNHTHMNKWIHKHEHSLYLRWHIHTAMPNQSSLTLTFTNTQKRRSIISLYLRDDKLLFSVVGAARDFLLCSLKTFWLAIHGVHYNSEASLIILFNQTMILSFNLKPTLPVRLAVHCRHFGSHLLVDSHSAYLKCLWLCASI